MSDHTETPWRVSLATSSEGHTFIYGAASWPIAKAFERRDADFIVKAVNCHDELLEALKALLDEDVISTFPIETLTAAERLARAAIAKAKPLPTLPEKANVA